MNSHSGKIVKTKKGLIGRTYNSKELINGKVAVYLSDEQDSSNTNLETPPTKFKEHGMLCDPESLKVIGFID